MVYTSGPDFTNLMWPRESFYKIGVWFQHIEGLGPDSLGHFLVGVLGIDLSEDNTSSTTSSQLLTLSGSQLPHV